MKTVLSVAILSMLACGAVQAQKYEIGIFGGYPRMTHTNLGSISPEQPADTDTKIKGEYSEGAWLTLNTKGYYGHEIGYMITRFKVNTILRNTVDNQLITTNAEDRRAVHMPFYNFLIYFMPNESKWRPYITGGAQAYQYQRPHIDAWPDKSFRHYGFNWGGGLKLIPFPHALVRLDFRDYIGGRPYDLTFADQMSPGSLVHQMEGTIGFGVTF